MSSEAGSPDPVTNRSVPDDGVDMEAGDAWLESAPGAGPAGPGSQATPVVLRSPYDETPVAKPYGEIPAAPADGRTAVAHEGPSAEDEGLSSAPQVPVELQGRASETADPRSRLPQPLAPGAVEQPVGPSVGSLFEPVPPGDSGHLADRPDVSQVLCTDHDVRHINLTALRPVAAMHPFPLVFSSVSGAHLYGFPSVDSDVDLRGVHLLPAVQVVGLRHGPQTVERTWLHDEVKLDLVTYDVGKFFRLLLRRNGYVLEQLLSPLVVTTSGVHEELVAIAEGCLTRGLARHYRGFARGQWELYEQSGQLKPLLYTFRVLLTGIHVIRTGQLIAHLPTLLELVRGVPGYVAELIEAKSTAEEGYAPELPERVADDVATLQAELDLAEGDSPLPDDPVAEGALHDLLVRLRLEGTSACPV
jgi:predicted nucleotidyltransferase